MTEEERLADEAAGEAEAHADDISQWDKKAVKVRVATAPRHVFSLKLGAEELDEIAAAAETLGLGIGTYIRDAALEKARSQKLEEAGSVQEELTKAGQAIQRAMRHVAASGALTENVKKGKVSRP
jgi:hypothetical protein